MLLGAPSAEDLTEVTQRIFKEGTSACTKSSEKVKCVVFANAGVSVLASVVVNHHVRFYAPGTTLGQILNALPEKEQEEALATVAVDRPSGRGLYAHVTFPRSLEYMRMLILLSGDRVNWS